MIKKISCALLTFSVCVTLAVTPQWTPEQSKRVLSAVMNPGKIILVSKKHPQSEADSMGISHYLKMPNEHIARFQLSWMLLTQANVDFSPFETANCPEASQVAYFHYLTKGKNPRLLGVLDTRYGQTISGNLSGFFRGYYATHYEDTADYIAAVSFFQNFFRWYSRSKSPLIGCFTDADLASVHTALGLFYQRQEGQQQLMEDHLKRAVELQPRTVSCLHNLADCYQLRQQPEEEAKYRRLVTTVEAQTGASPAHDGVSIHLQLPSGMTVPIQHVRARGADAERVVQKGMSLEESHRKLNEDPEFQGRFVRGVLQEYASFTPSRFAQLQDSACKLVIEINQVPGYKDQEQKLALMRINERLPVVTLDHDLMCSIGELFKKTARKHPSETSQLKQTIRSLITPLVEQDGSSFLSMSYLSGVEGLGEEVAFLYRQKMNIAPNIQIAFKLWKEVNGVAKERLVQLDSLHLELLGNLKAQQRPCEGVLRILQQKGIVENSALYKFWHTEWQKTWGKEQEEKRVASAKKAQEEHEEFWDAVLEGGSSALAAGTAKKTGAAVCHIDDDQPTVATVVAPRFNSHATFAEAERLAMANRYALPAGVNLELKVETASGGSGSIQILYERTSEGKTELARSRPHVHYRFNEQESKAILWQYHLLKEQFNKDC